MTMTQVIAVLCVLGMTVGQVLFKVSASALSETGTYFSFKTASALMAAMALYAITSLAWVWVLQRTELGRVYPLMALAFVLVPLGSNYLLGERFSSQYFLGIFLIMVGIIVSLRS